MRSLCLVFLVISGAVAATPAPPPTARSLADCELALGGFGAETLKRFKLTPELLQRTTDQEHRLVTALSHLATFLDESRLSRLAHHLIEQPKATDEATLRDNPFFAESPAAIKPVARANFVVVRDLFGDQLDTYDLGLLAALIPDLPRAADFELSNVSENQKFAKLKATLDVVKDHPGYRATLAELIHKVAQSWNFRGYVTTILASMERSDIDSWFDMASVEEVVAHVRKGRASRRDLSVTSIVMNVLASQIIENVGRLNHSTDTDRLEYVNGVATKEYYRSEAIGYAEQYLAEQLHILEGLDQTLAIFDALTYLSPMPTPARQLRQAILTTADTLVAPIRLRLRHVPAPAAAPKLPAGPARPMVFNLVDHTAPAPVKRRVRQRDAVSPAAEPTPPARPLDSIPVERRLRELTSFVGAPQPIEALRANYAYEFWYIRDADQHLRRARFSAAAVAWMHANRVIARRFLNALHLGQARGTLGGIKPLGATSKRYDGQIFEIKIHGKFRALLIQVGDEWQILTVVHKDDLEREVLWLTPIADV